MSILSSMYNKIYNIRRSTTVSATGTDTATQIVTGSCLFRPVTNRTDLFKESNWGKEYKMFCDSVDNIRIADIIEIDGVKYGIAGIPSYEDLENNTESLFEVRIYKK